MTTPIIEIALGTVFQYVNGKWKSTIDMTPDDVVILIKRWRQEVERLRSHPAAARTAEAFLEKLELLHQAALAAGCASSQPIVSVLNAEITIFYDGKLLLGPGKNDTVTTVTKRFMANESREGG